MPVNDTTRLSGSLYVRLFGLPCLLAIAACGDGGPGPDDPPGVLSLSVGEGRTLTATQAATIEVSGGSAGAEFVLVPFHGSESPGSTVSLQLTGTQITGVTGPPSPGLSPGGTPSFSRRASTLESREAARARLDGELRRLERGELARLIPAARAAFARRPSYSAAGSGALAAAVPAVGDQLSFNVIRSPSCGPATDMRTGRVVAVTARAIIVSDNNNPTGGFTDAEYAEIGAQFDNLVYPLDVLYFGAPEDIDDNVDRVIIFYTRAVNELTPRGSDAVIGGFFHPRDIFPRTSTDPSLVCATSNAAEMFYMLVPDPTGVVNGNVRTKVDVRQSTVGVLGHEFQHLINASRRLYVNEASEFEETWLNEGLSHIAEELLFYSASGLAPRQNITLAQLVDPNTPAVNNAVNEFQVDNFGRLLEYLENPEGNSPYAENDELATRGATWQLLRYAADRSTKSQQAIWQELANSPTVGVDNFTSVLGDFFQVARDWATAQYTDDVLTTPPAHQHPSWHFRSIMPRLVSNSNPPPPYPLRTRTLVAGTPLTVSLVGGGAAYVRFGVAGGATGAITPSSTGTTSLSNVSFTVVRTK